MLLAELRKDKRSDIEISVASEVQNISNIFKKHHLQSTVHSWAARPVEKELNVHRAIKKREERKREEAKDIRSKSNKMALHAYSKIRPCIHPWRRWSD
jgi:hypothetical protein